MINILFSPFYRHKNKLLKAKLLHKSLLLLNCGRLWKSEATGKMGIKDFGIKKHKTLKKWKVTLTLICYFKNLVQVYQEWILFLFYLCTAMENRCFRLFFNFLKVTSYFKLFFKRSDFSCKKLAFNHKQATVLFMFISWDWAKCFRK